MDDTLRYLQRLYLECPPDQRQQFRELFHAGSDACGSLSDTTPRTAPVNGRVPDSNGAAYVGVQWKPNNEHDGRGLVLQLQRHAEHGLSLISTMCSAWPTRTTSASARSTCTRAAMAKPRVSRPGFQHQLRGLYGEAAPDAARLIPYAMVGCDWQGEQIRSPYSIGPSYLVQRIGENSRAGESTWIAGDDLRLRRIRCQGPDLDVNYGQRTTAVMTRKRNNGSSINDWDELATDLVYIFPQDGILQEPARPRPLCHGWRNRTAE